MKKIKPKAKKRYFIVIFTYMTKTKHGTGWRAVIGDAGEYINSSFFVNTIKEELELDSTPIITNIIELNKKDFEWAVETATKKKKIDCSSAEFLTIDEGLCVQIMHIGSFDDEPATVALMDEYLKQNGYVNDMNSQRLHHEIYLSDARKIAPEKWKTVIRHPIRKV